MNIGKQCLPIELNVAINTDRKQSRSCKHVSKVYSLLPPAVGIKSSLKSNAWHVVNICTVVGGYPANMEENII